MTISYVLVLIFMTSCTSFLTADPKCSAPQKGVFFSYNALSKRDTMPDVFKEINKNAKTYNSFYNNGTSQYNITNIHPQLYYN